MTKKQTKNKLNVYCSLKGEQAYSIQLIQYSSIKLNKGLEIYVSNFIVEEWASCFLN